MRYIASVIIVGRNSRPDNTNTLAAAAGRAAFRTLDLPAHVAHNQFIHYRTVAPTKPSALQRPTLDSSSPLLLPNGLGNGAAGGVVTA